MAFPSKPEPAKNGWINRSIEKFKAWAFSRQPIPDQQDFDVNEGFDGVRFSLKKVNPEQLVPDRREFDISVLSNTDKTVKVMRGTWMGRAEPSVNYVNPGTRDAYHTLTVANGNTIYVEFSTNTYYATVLTGASTPRNNEHVGLYYRELATVTIAAGVISINQYLWGPLEYTLRFNDRREFDVEPFILGASAVSVKGGTWMGTKGTGTDPLTRSEYFGLNVVNGDTVYVGYNSYYNTLTYYAGATVPADQPEYQQWYVGLATIAVTAGVVSVDQYRWGPLEYTKRYNTSYALIWDPTSSTAHTDSWYNYSPLDSAGAVRAGYNSVTWKGDRYYQTSSSITIDGVTFYVVTTKVFSRTVTIDSNGGTSYISAEFLKATWKWVSDTSV